MRSYREKDPRVRRRVLRGRDFGAVYFCILVLAGLERCIVLVFEEHPLEGGLETLVLLLYWAVVSLGILFVMGYHLKRRYDLPMRRLSEAAGKVASGDFTVSIRPEHNEDEADYLDVMIGDFNRMTAELRKVEILKTDFFSNVSHEFKTPLAVIQSYAGLLRKAVSDPVQKNHTEQILHSVKKLNGLITNLLKLNLLEHQTIPAVRKPYNLCEQLEECALRFEPVWEERKIEFYLEMEDHVMIESDRDLLEIVWSNLLSNAFKFTGSGGSVTLKQCIEGEEVLVSISDTGCGMDGEMILHIFDPFYQGDTSRSSEGNGLGLALVRRILELCGGSVTVQSRLGEGSEFQVRFSMWRQACSDGLPDRKAERWDL